MRRNLVGLLALLFAAWVSPIAQGAGDFTILHTFSLSNGGYPNGELILIGSTIYGTTTFDSGLGCVFKIDSDGSDYIPIHSFFNTFDVGCSPINGLISDGEWFYGTTKDGFDRDHYGGSVYRINTVGHLDVLHAFGPNPSSALAGDRRSRLTLIGSTLYGTTVYGGDYGAGSIYALDVSGNGYTELHSFDSGEASDIAAGPLTTNGSILFGTTELSGDYGKGAIYAINPNGTGFNVLHSFDGDDGNSPASFCGGLLLVGSTLYGTTEWGGEFDAGTIFKIDVDGTGFAVLHSFDGEDGERPDAGLTFSGSTLYGKTLKGGENDRGVIFQIDTDGTGYSVLHSFNSTEADEYLMGGLTTDGSKLYGVSRYGGDLNCGVLYSLTIPEPSTFALLGAGLFGLLVAGGWRRWRKG